MTPAFACAVMKFLWIVRGHVTQCIGRSQATQEDGTPIEKQFHLMKSLGSVVDHDPHRTGQGVNETSPGYTGISLYLPKPDCFAGAVRKAGSRHRNRSCAVKRWTMKSSNWVSAAPASPCMTTSASWSPGFPSRRHTTGIRMHGFHCSRRLGSGCRRASVSGPPACEFSGFAASFHPPLYLRPY